MFFILFLISLFITSNYSQTIKHLNEISIKEELPIGSIVTSLTDKIPNLDQSIEYDLVTPVSNELDLFAVNHNQHSLIVKNRIDYENLCLKRKHCVISVSIAVSNDDTIDVYILPIRLININDNLIKFLVNRTVIEIDENDENWSKQSYPLPRAYDEDGDPITYSLYLQNWNKPDGLFDFDEKNLLLKPLRKFDREEQNIYLLRLIAHNQNDVSTDIIVIIKDLNDNTPTCQQNQSIFLISNLSVRSIFFLNVTDLDEGDNGKLEYHLINPLAGFRIDRYNGQITFDPRKWIRSNESILIVNITDHGKPSPLSTKCFIQMKFTSLVHIDFQSDISIIKSTEIYMKMTNINLPLGRFVILDKQNNTTCTDCLVKIGTLWEDFFYLNSSTFDLYLNVNSVIVMKILTNYLNNQENVSLNVQIDVTNVKNPSILSTKNYSLIIHFDKIQLLKHSNIFFLKISENILLNERISIYNRYHSCLNNQSNELILSDPTDTFDIDGKFNLILKKYLNVKQQDTYHLTLQQRRNNYTDDIDLCSIQLHIYVLDPFSTTDVYPYFSQPFYILSSKNMSQFILPPIPPYVKYISSVPDLISINPFNSSMIIRSSSLYSSYYYDFQIKAIDSYLSSLSSSVAVRIIFGINQHAPRLLINSTRQTREVSSSKFLYQIKAYDPDISLNDQMNVLPPSIEYEIDTPTNIEIERFTGRIFLKELNTTKINFTIIMTDFGQPNRLLTRENLIFDIKSTEHFPISFLAVILLTFFTILLLSLVLFLINCCCTNRPKPRPKTTWKNISPTTPDTCLIDNEYMPTTSLPRTSTREQRIYPTHLTNDIQRQRRTIAHSLEKCPIDQDFQQRLSMTDINKYLERFEKIYNDSSSQQYLHEPIGSVV